MLLKTIASLAVLTCQARAVTLFFYSETGCISCCGVQCGDLEPDECCDASFDNHDIWEAADLSTYHGGTGLFFTLQTWATQLANANKCAVFLTRGSGCQEASTIQSGSYFQTQDGFAAPDDDDNATIAAASDRAAAAKPCKKADIYFVKDNGTRYELDFLDTANRAEIKKYYDSGDRVALVEYAKAKAVRITAIDAA
ncbi:hypothetical protein O9K51_05112 [Purpureocillium lavendulum]|uniref:Uncharacterized protein n=1 Tax=Purpureocillium lavendulum TaxID=1247861 RepID=A0AB34FSA1_9HYPO|nr:hypothetical protein O9K51_05112 [Purpureocillium lavendulum]